MSFHSPSQEGLQQTRNTVSNVQHQSNIYQHLKNAYQPGPQASNQHQTTIEVINQYPIKSSQYQGQSQGQYQLGQYQQNQGQSYSSQYHSNDSKPLLSTATRTNKSGNVWAERDLSSWQPKLTSGKWLQQKSAQQRTDTFSREDESNQMQKCVVSIFTPEKIKSSVASIFPIKLTRSSSITRLTKTSLSSSNQNLGNPFSVQTQTTDISRWNCSQTPINSSTAIPINAQPSVVSAFETSRNTQLSEALTSPVYKSKLEKAVEQNQNGGMVTNSNSTSKQGQGTLKKLLISDLADLDALKFIQNVEQKPQINFCTDQENQMINQNVNQAATVNKPVKNENHNRTKSFLKKKDMLLDRSQMENSEQQFKMSTFNGTSINQQSYPNMIGQPCVNVGLALSQLQQQLQNKENYSDSQIAESYRTTGPGPYKDTANNLVGFELKQHELTSDVIPKGNHSAHMLSEIVSQKEYWNPKWSDRVTEEQWRLREKGLFCDAIFHCKKEKFKVICIQFVS